MKTERSAQTASGVTVFRISVGTPSSLKTDEPPSLTPDYSGTVIPFNIAPMNFRIENEGSAFLARFQSVNGKAFEVRSRNGNIEIPARSWRRLLEENKGGELKIALFARDPEGWSEFRTITNTIAAEPIDPYITYRLLYPGYESWKEIFIKQRNLESFKERSIIENSLVEENCLNCHSYNNTGNTESFMVHMRGSLGGTYFYNDGNFLKVNLKPEELKNGAVYPRWHPSGKYVAYSSNKIVQQFHSALNKKVEVSDLESSLVLYDIEKNEIMELDLPEKEKYMDTYPEWSPDGNYLYFCRAPAVGEVFHYDSVRYDLCRVPFDQATKLTGPVELIYKASDIGKSVSFPRTSPDGYNIVITSLCQIPLFPEQFQSRRNHNILIAFGTALEADVMLVVNHLKSLESSNVIISFVLSWHPSVLAACHMNMIEVFLS